MIVTQSLKDELDNLIVTCSNDGAIKVFDAQSKKCVCTKADAHNSYGVNWIE